MALNEVGFERRGLGHAQHSVVVEVLLFHCAVANGDGLFENGTQGEEHAAFELRARAVRVYDLSAVHNGDESIDPDVVSFDGNLCYLRQIRIGRGASNSPTSVRPQRLSPIAFIAA
jgi:hypothetical protein